MEKLKERIKAVLAGKNAEAEIYMEESKRTEVSANEGEIEKITAADSFGAAIRVFKSGKMGTAYFTVKEEGAAEKAAEKALETALIQGMEKYRLPAPPSKPAAPIKLSDEKFSGINIERLKKAVLLLEASAKSNPRVRHVRDTTVASRFSRVNYTSTSGVDTCFEKTYFHAFTCAVSSDGASQEAVDASDGSVTFEGLEIEKLGKKCSQDAAGLLNGRPAKSGRYDILLPPHAASDIAALLSRLFTGNNINKGMSLLCGSKKGDMIAAKILTIRDDALLDYRAGSYPYDAEGSQGQNKAVVESGKLRGFLYDIINAERGAAVSTGNCVRQDFKAPPECGPSNFYIQKGSGSAAGRTGILVNSLMGLHMTDTVSGNFSLGINGWLLEKGEIKHAVRENLITGNIRDLLMKTGVVCGDLKFYGNFGSPTIVVNGLETAGK